jgi:hypothetical protein
MCSITAIKNATPFMGILGGSAQINAAMILTGAIHNSGGSNAFIIKIINSYGVDHAYQGTCLCQ